MTGGDWIKLVVENDGKVLTKSDTVQIAELKIYLFGFS